jgi:DNA-binding winged helix-turn-helix (wHTH) protein
MRYGIRIVVVAAFLSSATLVNANMGVGDERRTIGAGARRVETYDAGVPLAYYQLSMQLSKRTAGFTPPVQSRAYAYVGLALYEALISGMPDHRSVAQQLNGIGDLPQAEPGPYHWPLVANAALAEVMRGLWGGATNAAAANVADLDALEASFETQYAQIVPPLRQRSIALGRSVGAAVFETSKDDGGHEGYNTNSPVSYVPPVGPGLWVPTAPGMRATQPYWGTVMTPFALLSSSECDPGGPPAYSEQPGSAFYADAFETYQAVKNLTPEQLTIARFWGSIPGPGHSLAITSQILVQEEANLAVAAETYARVGIAVADAVIAVWSAKYHHNLLRPITYIRKMFDPAWSSPLATPAFPEYVSAHSSQSAAAATTLETLFGQNVAFVDHAGDADGFAPRSFPRIYAAAEEAGISRIYGGIHFQTANQHGQWQGRCVAAIVTASRGVDRSRAPVQSYDLVYRFDDFAVDVDTRQLLRAGEEIHLTPKAFELLQVLIENRARAMSKAELQERIWAARFVEETNLASLAAEIRRALGDTAGKPRFIRTVYGFGYRFIAAVTAAGHGSAAAPPGSRLSLTLERREFPLMAGRNVIGRASDAAVQIESAVLSRHHACIVVDDGQATVEDVGSKNGTQLNGNRVTTPVPLTDGDEIRLGTIVLTFRTASHMSPTETMPPAAD